MSPALRNALAAAVFLFVVGCDQVTKYAAVDALTVADGRSSWERFWTGESVRGNGGREVVAGFWHHIYAENRGVAFSMFASLPDGIRRLMLPLLQSFGIAVALVYMARTPRERALTRLGLIAAAAGGVGNLIDRVRTGQVIDFIVWHWRDVAYWPTFNIADVGVFVGIALIFIDELRVARSTSSAATK